MKPRRVSMRNFGACRVPLAAREVLAIGAMRKSWLLLVVFSFACGPSATVVQNGELSLGDLARLRQQPSYAAAKSVLITRIWLVFTLALLAISRSPNNSLFIILITF